MKETPDAATGAFVVESISIFGNSPLDRAIRKLGIRDRSRVIICVLLAWVPLLLLSSAENQSEVQITFLKDLTVHVRFLLALAFLISLEQVAAGMTKTVVPFFIERGMINSRNLASFSEVGKRIYSLSSSLVAELVLLCGAVAFSLSHFQIEILPGITTWRTLGFAGTWYYWVSLSIYHFILFRWLWRYLLWSYFLVRISRVKLDVQGHHPDQMAGLSFIPPRHIIFGVIASALSLVAASRIAQAAIYGEQNFTAIKFPLIAYFCILAVLYLVPLFAFTPLLIRAKVVGLRTYGKLASRHAIEFEEKWSTTQAESGPNPLGSADISSSNDLNSSFEHLEKMKIVLISHEVLVGLFLFAAGPLLPLVLLKMSFLDILKGLMKLFA